jgi:uncharacterized membrane protein YbhN (UPF0104 family)
MPRIALLVAKLSIAFMAIWALFSFNVIDLGDLRIVAERPLVVVSVVALLLLTFLLSAYRWYVLLRCQSINITASSAVRLTLLTLFVSTFLPGGPVGGDALRIAYVAKRLSSRRAVAVISIFLDRLLGLYALLLVVSAVALVDPTIIAQSLPLQVLATIAQTLSLAIPASILVLYFALRLGSTRLHVLAKLLPTRFLEDAIHKLIEGLRLYRQAPGAIAIALGLSILGFSLAMVCVMILGKSMQIGSLAPLDYGFAMPWASLASLLPVTPGGLGVGEVAFDRICHWREQINSGAAYGSIFLVHRIANVLATLPGLIFYLLDHDMFELRSAGS